MKMQKKVLLALIVFLFLVCCSSGSTWYVRPEDGEYGSEDGVAWATAYDGFSDITWGSGGVVAGDTLYVCGTFSQDTEASTVLMSVGASGTSGNLITIRGDYGGDAGIVHGAKSIAVDDGWTDNSDNSFWIMATAIHTGAVEGTLDGTETLLTIETSQAEVAANDGSWLRKQYAIDAFSDIGGGEVQADFTLNHDFSNGDTIRIWGTTNYNGSFVITSVDADSIKFTDTWVSDDGTGVATDDILWYNPTGGSLKVFWGNWYGGLQNNGNDYITYESLTSWFGHTRANIDIFHTGDPSASYVTVNNCSFKYAANYQIHFGSDDNITITNNTFEEFPAGIAGAGSPTNITIRGNTFDSGDFYSKEEDGVDVDNGAMQIQVAGGQWRIEDNLINKAQGFGIHLYKNASSVVTDLIIRRNYITNIIENDESGTGYGIYISGAKASTYADRWAGLAINTNVIKDIDGTIGNDGGVGIRVKAGYSLTSLSDRIKVYNNTVSDCNFNYYVVAGWAEPDPAGVIMKNNISYAPKTGGFHAHISSSLTDIDMDYNFWYPDTAAGDNQFEWRSEAVADDFADFVSDALADGSVIGGNSQVIDPELTDVTRNKFYPKTGSPVIGAGVDVGLTSGRRGGNMTNPPDIGSDVYGPVYLLF